MREKIFKEQKDRPEFFRMAKPNIQIPNFMEDCMDGAPHPMQIEYDDYTRVYIGRINMDTHRHSINSFKVNAPAQHNLTEEEEEIIQNFKDRPEVQWAIHNSFDGLFIKKEYDYANLRTLFMFAVYMKNTNKTFWILKYKDQAML